MDRNPHPSRRPDQPPLCNNRPLHRLERVKPYQRTYKNRPVNNDSCHNHRITEYTLRISPTKETSQNTGTSTETMTIVRTSTSPLSSRSSSCSERVIWLISSQTKGSRPRTEVNQAGLSRPTIRYAGPTNQRDHRSIKPSTAYQVARRSTEHHRPPLNDIVELSNPQALFRGSTLTLNHPPSIFLVKKLLPSHIRTTTHVSFPSLFLTLLLNKLSC